MIKIEHLVKNYGSNCAVDDISFEELRKCCKCVCAEYHQDNKRAYLHSSSGIRFLQLFESELYKLLYSRFGLLLCYALYHFVGCGCGESQHNKSRNILVYSLFVYIGSNRSCSGRYSGCNAYNLVLKLHYYALGGL